MAALLLSAPTLFSTPLPRSSSRPGAALFFCRGVWPIKCKAAEQGSSEGVDAAVYQGFYGPWTVEASDIREDSVMGSWKLEAGVLTFFIHSLLLGHLTGLMDDNIKLSLLGAWMALFVIFSARKFTQPVKDDIGDKSMFMFNVLPEEEKQALIQKLEQQNQNT